MATKNTNIFDASSKSYTKYCLRRWDKLLVKPVNALKLNHLQPRLGKTIGEYVGEHFELLQVSLVAHIATHSFVMISLPEYLIWDMKDEDLKKDLLARGVCSRM